MSDSSHTPFETSWVTYSRLLEDIENSCCGREIFISAPALYQILAATNPVAAADVYWVEMLGRCYLAGAAGLVRSRRWLQGVSYAITQNNYLSFGANLRGLLESAADQSYSLNDAPKTLAENYSRIMKQLMGISSFGEMYLCGELENRLIHFYHASRPQKGEKGNRTHSALKMTDYLASLQGSTSGPVFELYAALCDISHPAMGGFASFVAEDPEGGYSIRKAEDRRAIIELCNAHTEAIRHMTAGMNCCLLTLRVLNEFPMKDVHTEPRILDFDLPGWATISKIIAAERNTENSF